MLLSHKNLEPLSKYPKRRRISPCLVFKVRTPNIPDDGIHQQQVVFRSLETSC